MSINVKKYTKDQMAKMVEDAQAEVTALEAEIAEMKNCIDEKNDLLAEYANLKAEMQRKNATLTEQLDQMNGEAINKANEIANLKADLDSAKNMAQHLNDQGQQYWRAWQASKREVADLKNKLNDAEQRADYAERHPWRNLRAWLKRKMVRHE